MSDGWLSILNRDGDKIVCLKPQYALSMVELRTRISEIRIEVNKFDFHRWILYDEDIFSFLCAFFALLLEGKSVLIPSSGTRQAIESLSDHNVGLIGYQKATRRQPDIKLPCRVTPPNQINPGEGILHPLASWGRAIFYTSGSTGQPKAVCKTPEQLYLEAHLLATTWSVSSSTVFFPLVTHLHMYGLAFGLLFPFFAGAIFYAPRRHGILSILEPINISGNHKVDNTVVVASPTIGRKAEQIVLQAADTSLAGKKRPAKISRVYCAGGVLSEKDARGLQSLFGCPVTEIFGSTETGAIAKRHRSFATSADPHWQTLSGLEVVSQNSDRNGKNSELMVWGGHVGGSEASPISTGDLVADITADGFRLTGRNTHLVKIEGLRVSLTELAQTLERCELINEAIVSVAKSEEKEYLVSAVVLADKGIAYYRSNGMTRTNMKIRACLQDHYNPVLIPKVFRYLEAIPRNILGKIAQEDLQDAIMGANETTSPVVEDVNRNDSAVALLLRIPINLRYFRGHFENKPIVPGIVLLHWVYNFCQKYLGVAVDSTRIKRLKFNKILGPGEVTWLTINLTQATVIYSYKNKQGDFPIASGELFIESNEQN